MALFRFHRGGLIESLKTTTIIRDIDDLADLIGCPSDALEVKPYPDEKNNFDPRIGLFSYIVLKEEGDGKKYPIGFTSENIK